MATLLLWPFLPAKPALAATTQASGCPIPDLGKKVPVVLVHGLWGEPSIWGSKKDTSTMLGLVNEFTSVYVDDPFDYHKVSDIN